MLHYYCIPRPVPCYLVSALKYGELRKQPQASYRVFPVWVQVEGTRGLREYMSLPPSEYSVLDAEKVQRMGESTFRYDVRTQCLGQLTYTTRTRTIEIEENKRKIRRRYGSRGTELYISTFSGLIALICFG